MTTTTTRTLAEERDRLDQRRDELLERIDPDDEDAATDTDSASGQRLWRELNTVDQAGQAVGALIDRHGEAAEVTVRPLNGDLYGRVEDRVDTLREFKKGPGGVPGSSRNVYAAAGLIEAPFMDGRVEYDGLQRTAGPTLQDRTEAVASQTPAPGVAMWLEGLVNDVGQVETGNWQPLERRIAASSK